MTASFGPWSTTIDTRPTRRLNTFWQSRLMRLPGVWRAGGALSWRAKAVSAAVAIVCFAIPTLRVTAVFSQPKEDDFPGSHPAARFAEVQPGGPGSAAALMEEFTSRKFFWEQSEVGDRLVALGDKSVVPALVALLKSPDRHTRCNAGCVLARLGDERGLPAVIAELKDRSHRPAPDAPPRSDGGPNDAWQITQDRYYAAGVLGEIGDRRAVPALIEALQDETIQNQAASVFGCLGDPRAVPALLAALEKAQGVQPQSAQSDMRLYAAYGLMGLKHPTGMRVISEFLRGDHDAELRPLYVPDALSQQVYAAATASYRRHAAYTMAQFGAKTAVPLLVRALDDKDDEVFLQVIRALARIGDPAAAAPLRALLQNGRRLAGGTHVRFWAGYALMGLKDPQGFPTVAEYLGREQEPMQRRAAVDALRELGDKSAVGLLAGLIHDNDPDVRADAIVALGHVGDATSLPALRELLNDPDQRVGRFISARRPFLRMTTVTPGEAAQRAIREIERRGGVPGR